MYIEFIQNSLDKHVKKSPVCRKMSKKYIMIRKEYFFLMSVHYDIGCLTPYYKVWSIFVDLFYSEYMIIACNE